MMELIKKLFNVAEPRGDLSKHRVYASRYEDMCQ